jgi:hypothetical protein
MGQLIKGNEVIRCQRKIGAILQLAEDRYSNSWDLERALGVMCGSVSIDLYPEDDRGDILCCQTTISGRALADRSIDRTAVQDFAAKICTFVEKLVKPLLSVYAFDGCDIDFISHGILNDSDDKGTSDDQFESMSFEYSFQGW